MDSLIHSESLHTSMYIQYNTSINVRQYLIFVIKRYRSIIPTQQGSESEHAYESQNDGKGDPEAFHQGSLHHRKERGLQTIARSGGKPIESCFPPTYTKDWSLVQKGKWYHFLYPKIYPTLPVSKYSPPNS